MIRIQRYRSEEATLPEIMSSNTSVSDARHQFLRLLSKGKNEKMGVERLRACQSALKLYLPGDTGRDATAWRKVAASPGLMRSVMSIGTRCAKEPRDAVDDVQSSYINFLAHALKNEWLVQEEVLDVLVGLRGRTARDRAIGGIVKPIKSSMKSAIRYDEAHDVLSIENKQKLVALIAIATAPSSSAPQSDDSVKCEGRDPDSGPSSGFGPMSPGRDSAVLHRYASHLKSETRRPLETAEGRSASQKKLGLLTSEGYGANRKDSLLAALARAPADSSQGALFSMFESFGLVPGIEPKTSPYDLRATGLTGWARLSMRDKAQLREMRTWCAERSAHYAEMRARQTACAAEAGCITRAPVAEVRATPLDVGCHRAIELIRRLLRWTPEA